MTTNYDIDYQLSMGSYVRSAYAFFVKQCSSDNEAAHPGEGLNHLTFMRNVQQKWRGMSEEEKQPFFAMQEVDILHHQPATPEPPAEAIEKKPYKNKRKKDAELKSEQAISAFSAFCVEEREKVKKDHPNLGVRDTAIMLGRLWRDSSSEFKDIYEQEPCCEEVLAGGTKKKRSDLSSDD